MKLVASMNVRNELGRYLERVIGELLEVCDEIRVQDDYSTDGSYEWLSEQDGVRVYRNAGPGWDKDESALHESLFRWTLDAQPTHILAIDADEVIPGRDQLRGKIEAHPEAKVFTLRMCEVWGTDPYVIRTDGGWRAHEVGILYRTPTPRELRLRQWAWPKRRMASGRVPRAVASEQRRGRAVPLGLDILHLGWANPAEREDRHRRYVELDGGEFHARAHLDSILLPDEKIDLEPYPA